MVVQKQLFYLTLLPPLPVTALASIECCCMPADCITCTGEHLASAVPSTLATDQVPDEFQDVGTNL